MMDLDFLPEHLVVILGSHVLLAIGRRPDTDDLGLAAAGIDTDARGFIRVDDQCRTHGPGGNEPLAM